jgi:hypothetical protein
LTFGDEVELIAELCPDGVEYVELNEVLESNTKSIGNLYSNSLK